MKIRIVIPVHNQVEFLRECLASIRQTTLIKYHEITVHIIDNGSVENLTDALRALGDDIGLILTRFDQNKGVTVPWNFGLKCGMDAGADVICISNSDVVYGPKAIQNCAEAARHYGVTFPFSIQGGPKPPDFDVRAEAATALPWERNTVKTGGFAGWCFFLARETVEKIGMFDEQFTLWYGDSDYHWRLAAASIPPMEVRSCLLHHYESRTILSMPGQFECHGWRAQDEKNFFAKYPRK